MLNGLTTLEIATASMKLKRKASLSRPRPNTYQKTMLPLVRSGMPRMTAVRLALAADTASIALMEIIDNAIMWVIPGAMDAGLDSPLFWGSLALSLVVAGLAAWPLNRWLIGRGQGHAVVHAHHGH